MRSGLREHAGPHGDLARSFGPPARVGQVAVVEPVTGYLARPSVRISARSLLEHLGDPPVQGRPAARFDLGLHGVADQRVGEAHPLAGHRLDDPVQLAEPESAPDVPRGHLQDRPEHGGLGLRAENAQRLGDVQGGCPCARERLQDDVPQLGQSGQRLSVPAGPAQQFGGGVGDRRRYSGFPPDHRTILPTASGSASGAAWHSSAAASSSGSGARRTSSLPARVSSSDSRSASGPAAGGR